MSEVITVQDLETLKKHEIFEAEVLTGKAGGLATGADIDYATSQVTGQVQKTLPAILRDIGFTPASFDFTSGGTLAVNDRDKAVLWPLPGGDGDWYYWEGALPKVIPPASSPASTGGVANGAWRPVGDITLRSDLAGPSGASLVGFIQSGAGASPRNAQNKMREAVTPEDFGAAGDGVVNDTTAVTLAITEALVKGVALKIKKNNSVTSVTFPAGLHVIFDGGRFTARDTSIVLTVGGDNVTVEDPVIDMNNQSYRGLFAFQKSGLRILGTTQVSNAKTGGASYNGGVILEECTDLVVGDVVGKNINQNGVSIAGLYRTFELNKCTGFIVGKVRGTNGDILFGAPGSKEGYVDAAIGKSLTDNGVYILDDAKNFEIGSVWVDGCGEGIVFNSSNADANIHIGSVFARNCTAKGLALRTGGNYHIGSCTLVEASMEQLTGFTPGVANLRIGTLSVYNMTSTAFRALTMIQNSGVTVGVMDLHLGAPFGGEAARWTDCDQVNIGLLRINGIGAAIGIGMRFMDGAAPVANPVINVDNYAAQNVTTPASIQTAVKTNVRVRAGEKFTSNLTLQQFGVAKLQLENLNTAMVAGDLLGLYQVYSNDGSGPGVKFLIETQAAGGNGSFGQTYHKNDAGTIVASVPPNAVNSGMSVKLPTSASGLTSGMIWNNAGSVAIVP